MPHISVVSEQFFLYRIQDIGISVAYQGCPKQRRDSQLVDKIFTGEEREFMSQRELGLVGTSH